MANSITISGTLISSAAPAPADMCQVSGYVKDVQGNALKSTELVVRHTHSPLGISTDTLILQEYQAIKTDNDGFLSFNLWQGAVIQLELPGRTGDMIFSATVPELSSIDLLDLILPYVVSVAFDEASLSETAGDNFDVALTGTLSNGETVDVSSAVTLSSGNDAVALLVSGYTFTAVAAGSTTISADSIDTDLLDLFQESDGDVIARLDVPAATLPSALSVTVT